MKNQASVLVIDDEQIICDSCQRILSNEDYKVETDTDSKGGYKKAVENDYDLILLDLNMRDMDGMQLLTKLRKDKPDVPVIIITGYPTKETKEESKKMGVNNYILKPFKPNEILDPVKSIIAKSDERRAKIDREQKGVSKSKDDKPIVWKASEEYYRFYMNGWLQKGTDSVVRVGGQLPVLLNEPVKSIRMAGVNEVMYKGLPIAEINYANDITVVVPSPVSGEIVELNEEMKRSPYLFEEDDRNKNWIINMLPENPEEGINECETRNVVLFSKDDKTGDKYFSQLKNLGYMVNKFSNIEDVIKTIGEEQNKVVILDAKSFGDKGPQFAETINERYKDAKIIVFNITDTKLETLYREKKIFYYAVDPISSKEIASILYGAFCFIKDKEKIENTQTTFLPQTIRRIQITNRHSKKVVVLAYDNVIQFNKGVGYLLIQKLLENAYPIEIVHTKIVSKVKDPASLQHIAEEKQRNDKVILLYKDNLNRIPGSIVKASEKYENSGGTDNTQVKIGIQPVNMHSEEIAFDLNTTKALAALFEEEMTHE
jgi:DNA-binding response OmpR family regulator/glycine cleavage system H lipoate-binding protein